VLRRPRRAILPIPGALHPVVPRPGPLAGRRYGRRA